MQRRTFLIGLMLALAGSAWGEDRRFALGSLLLGSLPESLPEELGRELDALEARLQLSECTPEALQARLQNWPEGEQACRKFLLRWLDPWAVCDFAHRPGCPPPEVVDWSRPR